MVDGQTKNEEKVTDSLDDQMDGAADLVRAAARLPFVILQTWLRRKA
jgi:hypothetical protein